MISVVVVMKDCNYVGFSNIFLQPSFPKEKGVILNDTCRIVLLIALSILETLFLKLGGTYYIEIDKLRDYQQKLNIHHFLSCSIFGNNNPATNISHTTAIRFALAELVYIYFMSVRQ